MRTQKQVEQWEYRFLLGTLLGLARWITSKESVILKSTRISYSTRMRLLSRMEALAHELKQAAYETGWKGPKP